MPQVPALHVYAHESTIYKYFSFLPVSPAGGSPHMYAHGDPIHKSFSFLPVPPAGVSHPSSTCACPWRRNTQILFFSSWPPPDPRKKKVDMYFGRGSAAKTPIFFQKIPQNLFRAIRARFRCMFRAKKCRFSIFFARFARGNMMFLAFFCPPKSVFRISWPLMHPKLQFLRVFLVKI